MRNILLLGGVLLLFLFTNSAVSAQFIFPVTASMQSTPPHSGSLSDLVAPASNKLSLVLNLEDAEELTYQVRLRVTIEGNGITLSTKNNLLFSPLELTYGSPSIFREFDLQEYFDPAAFDYVGYSLNSYLNDGGLPDGFYTICIEAYDYLQSIEGAASNKTCTVINASQLDAPVIQSPIGDVNNVVDPQNLSVNWINMHNVAIPVEHTLEIYTWPYASNLMPDQVVQFDLPFFTTNLMSTTAYVVTPADPPLVPGERYLIRVRAEDLSMTYLFKNQGWSEIQVFYYGDACGAPTGLAADSVSTEAISVSWLPPGSSPNSYAVRYRENIEGANWYEDEQPFTEHTLEGLEDNTIYQIQVQSICGGVPGLLSNIIEVKTDSFEFDPTTFECGDDVSFPEIANQAPIAASQIGPGDWITVGGFQAKITAIAPGIAAGSFNGACQVKIDWLGSSFNARFKNLFINTDRIVFDGNIICTSGGLRSLAGFVPPDSVDQLTDAGVGLCGDTIFADTTRVAGTTNPNAYDILIPNGTRDAYNPYNKVKPYDPENYDDPNNPYTETNPYDETNEWNPHNTFNPYDPFDYDDPANPYSADDPYVAANMSLRSTGSLPGGTTQGAKTLPFGLTSQGSNQDYMIAMDKMAFTTNGAIMNAYISLPIPKPGGGQQYASFMMKGIRFHAGGLIGVNKLVLSSDISFKLGPKAVVTFEGGIQSYVSFDCHGLTGISVKGKVEMCRDILTPIDWAGHGLDTNGYVTGYFYAAMPEWGEFVADLSITPFEVPGLKDWAFVVENAVFDFSDGITPASVVFPKNYSHPDVTGTKGISNPAWTGFYMKALRVRLPKQFNKGVPSDTTQADTSGQTPLDPNNMDSTSIAELNERIYDANQIEIGVEGVIIDDTGITLYVYGSNLLTLEEGRVGPWGFAIDSVGIGIQSSEFKNGYLKGKVDIPALGTPLSYSVVVAPETEYSLTVAIDSSVTINAFAASVTLVGGSSVTLQYLERTKRWDGICNLNGYATIKANMNTDTTATARADTSSRLDLPSLHFESLKFMTKAPYINIGNWSLTSDKQGGASNFPVMINQIGAFQSRDNKRVAFIIDAAINLKPTNDSNNGEGNGFSAYGKMGIISKIITDPDTERQSWEFERVRVDEFGLEVSAPGFKLKGEILFYENVHLYGTGFRASILVEVQPAITLEAVAQFGEIDGFRYFFVDAFLGVNPGIPLGPSGMAIYGFGGGISYKMKRTGFNDMELPDTSEAPDETNEPIVFDNPDPDAATGIPRPAESWFDPTKGRNLKPLPAGTDPNIVPPDQRLGLSVSGMRYVPDVNSGIGIKVMLAAGAVKREVFYGKVTLEILFTASGGLQSIGFNGDLSFMTPPDPATGKPSGDPSLRATIDMLYDNTTTTFYAKLGIYVSVYGGAISGAYPQNLAGQGRIFANPTDWYVHIGTPTKPVKITLDITKLAENLKDKNSGGAGTDSIPGDFQNNSSDSLDVAQGGVSVGNVGMLISAYLDFGTIIPDFPPLPDEVTSILGAGYNLNGLDDDALGSGAGLLFGAKLAVEMRDLTFLFFYADFYAGIGFDLMMRDYGEAARCDGIPTDGPIGINGWYATGQLYAYLHGEVGLFFNIFGSEKKIEILEIGAAAVLQARLPSPIWMRGAVAGYFSVLNGLISGDCNFKFELGEQCIIIGSTSPATDFITDISPDQGETQINVFERPRVTFSLPVGEEFLWEDIDGNINYYRAKLHQFTVLNANQGTPSPIAGELVWNASKTVLAFAPTEVLPQNSSIVAGVRVLFETKKTYNDPWLPLFDNYGNEAQDTMQVVFTTGAAPQYIPVSNIAYSYPIINQMYFLKNESTSGFIQLKQGQSYLFKNQPDYELNPTDWNQKIVFAQDGQVTTPLDFTYSGKRVSFAIPVNELNNSTITSFSLLNIPVNAAAAIDANLDSILIAYVADPGIPDSVLSGVSADIRQNKLESSSIEMKVNSIFKAGFRTSMHNSWSEKVASFNLSDQFYDPMLISPPPNQLSIDEFGARITAPEKFDKAEVTGYYAQISPSQTLWIPPLVSPQAVLTSTANNWFGAIQNTLYDHVPNIDIPLARDAEIFGSPPSKAVLANVSGDPQELIADNIEYNFVDISDRQNWIRYRVPYIAFMDASQLRQDVADFYYSDPNPPAFATTLLNWYFPYPQFGDYAVQLNYQLPGMTIPSSSVLKTLTYGN